MLIPSEDGSISPDHINSRRNKVGIHSILYDNPDPFELQQVGRQPPEDQLIDYWVALEALFLSEKNDLSYRAGNRIACFLEPAGLERVALFKIAKDSYNLRSRVVHGTPVKEKDDLPDMLAKTNLATT